MAGHEGARQEDGAEAPPSLRSEGALLALVFAVALGVYAATMPTTVTLEDSGELISIAHAGGIAHPPGYPIYSLLGRVFAAVPLASPAVRIHALSAVCAAGACAGLYFAVLLVVRRRDAGLLAAGLLAFSATFWSQAIIAEVYALHALLFLSLLCSCLHLNRAFRRSTLRWIALLFGLCLAHHWPLALLGVGTPILLLAGHRRHIAADLPALAGCLLLGLSAYGYLFVSALLEPSVTAWNDVRSLSDFLTTVTRARYAGVEASPGGGISHLGAFLAFFARAQIGELSLPIALLIAPGILAAWRILSRREFAALAWAYGSSSLVLFAFVSWEFDDVHSQIYLAYQLVPFAIAAFWIACGTTLVPTLPPGARGVVVAIAVAVTFLSNLEDNQRRDDTLAWDYARSVLESLPEDAALVVNADFDTGPIAYAQHVEGLRPDVTVYSRTGYLFRTRLADSSRPGWQQRAAEVAGRIVETRGSIFDTDLGHSDLVRETLTPRGRIELYSRFAVTDHGLVAQIGDRPVALPIERLRESATNALDAETAGRYADRWSYLKDIVLGRFCATLLKTGRADHPAFRAGPACQRELAIREAALGEFEGASSLLWAILEEHPTLPRSRRQRLYNDYFLMELNRLGLPGSPGAADLAAYQALADRVAPALDLHPDCDNAVLPNLMTLSGMTGVRIPRDAIRERFADCANLRTHLEGLDL